MILAIDQGTTGTTCLVVDDDLNVIRRSYAELPQHYPRPGWVEHDPEEIWASVLAAAELVGLDGVEAIALTNQRETTVLWERGSGRPVAPAIVWQDRRTAERCRELDATLIRERTGLVPDPYFSATKLEWLLHEHPGGDLTFGTVDSWLLWKLTRGAVHATDVTNACRTMLCNLGSLEWDHELLELFGVDPALLPAILPSAGDFGDGELLGRTVPVRGVAGDQQAALYGQGCHTLGEAKATYGTGSFVLVHAGADGPPVAPHGLLATAAPDGYALEGAVLVAGAALQWLRDGLGVLASAEESEALATSVDSAGGVVFVPALTGLGSPWWEPDARGLVHGLTRGTTGAHLVRAALEAIAHQVADVADALPQALNVLRADGGAAANSFLMQFQADLLGVPVEVAAERETTALGAAALAARRPVRTRVGIVYEPRRSSDEVESSRAEWRSVLATLTGTS